ncbi:hypothetical protein N7492_009986 [Penicillium capsulatum]|uniref:Uncharacterized protein n=1 Tax=Penicillium capsulatum TaxID=69766 RepID=A0A9W9HLJ6_9EURO|nr:hypothetical protein N7492_009986 [Penicillium capsulatum]KAJ6112495.1 hypothetical protein N7512_007819 [Penicillium capsulatum]
MARMLAKSPNEPDCIRNINPDHRDGLVDRVVGLEDRVKRCETLEAATNNSTLQMEQVLKEIAALVY